MTAVDVLTEVFYSITVTGKVKFPVLRPSMQGHGEVGFVGGEAAS